MGQAWTFLLSRATVGGPSAPWQGLRGLASTSPCTNRQRAPIYEQLRRHLAGIDDVRVFADADPEEAARIALEYADDFRLLEDIGWDREDPRESIRLTMRPTDLSRVLMRLRAEAVGDPGTRVEDGKSAIS